MAYVPTEAEKARKLRSAQAAACVALDYGWTPDEVRQAVEAGIAEIAARNAMLAESQQAVDEAQARAEQTRHEADAANERARQTAATGAGLLPGAGRHWAS